MTPTPAYLLQMVRDFDDKHEDGHKRLRDDFRRLERRVEDLGQQYGLVSTRLAQHESTPPDVTKLYFSPRVVFSIVIVVLGLAAGQWELNVSLRDRLLSAIDVNNRMQDERSAALKASIDAMQRRQELQQYEIQGLKETILKLHK